ncbi:Zn(2)-C6 fungal-type DNA-binding domain-containing protein [Fusarium pseudocircinatum]|uniref:Zn(2)-C6 fungal-type DNA-binding domain-containing protein n=1 Tax=Fusarium pseudocircinatum TaxID=56676 RepID=A0A8H5NZV6_9HYPO|nr:Zn(2)-C6 fungal-type DNA-binding domain-containing protein [Fusarium pseudocircinatum]
MSLPSPSSEKQPETGLKQAQTKTANRSRSACDACRRSKIKCSGGNPCSTCRWSQTRCHYTPGRRLGRPKGSKNKRTLLQQDAESIDEDQQDDAVLSNTGPVLWATGQQLPLDLNLDLDGCDSISRFMSFNGFLNPHDSLGNETSDFIDSTLSLIDPMSLDANPAGLGYMDITQGEDVERLSNAERAPNLDSDHGPGSSPSTGPVSPMASPLGCSCLPQLARLLYELEGLRYPDGPSSTDVSVDSLLRGFQTAEQPWKTFMHCSAHKTQGDHKAALLLFAISIRKVLNKAISSNIQTHSERETSGELSVSIGTIKLTGEARSEILTLAVGRAMRNIIAALQHVRGCIVRFSAPSIGEMDVQFHGLAKGPDMVHNKNGVRAGLPSVHACAQPRKETILLLVEVLEKTIEGLE